MVAFNGHGRSARKRHRFDHVWIERPLGKEFCAFNGIRVFLEHVDEEAANDLALGFGVGLALKFAHEQVLLVGIDQRDVVVFTEHFEDFFGLVLAQKAVVHENAGQLVANRFVDQDRSNRRIDAARQAADDFLVADLGADRSDRLFAVGAHCPVALKARQFDEVLIELGAVGCVVDLRVELHGVEIARHVSGDRERRVWRSAINLKAGGDGGDVVAVAHPDLFFFAFKPTV